MEEDREYEKKRREEGGKRIEIFGDEGKKKRGEQAESNGGEKMF